MEAWRKVWRDGIAPQLSESHLSALQRALQEDDPRLLQGTTTSPPPLMSVWNWPCEGGCALSFCGWQGQGLDTVGEVEEFFARTCTQADIGLGQATAIRSFLTWFDDTPRDEMRMELLSEVTLALEKLSVAAA